MKKIIFYQHKSENLILIDDDNTDIEVYTNELNKILNSNNIVKIETSSGVALIRPSKITSIYVEEIFDYEQNIEQTKNIKIEKEIITDDIITDRD